MLCITYKSEKIFVELNIVYVIFNHLERILITVS